MLFYVSIIIYEAMKAGHTLKKESELTEVIKNYSFTLKMTSNTPIYERWYALVFQNNSVMEAKCNSQI